MAENSNYVSDDDYFDDANKKGAPSALLKSKNDFVQGKVVRFQQRDMTIFGTNPPKPDLDDDGNVKRQMVIILQTEYRNWDKVGKVPTAKDGAPRPAEEDEGLRAIYVPRFTNIYAAFGKALQEASVKKIEVDGWFGVKVTELEDVGKGNPLKHHAVKYQPPEKPAEGDPFGEFEAPSAGKAVKDDTSLSEPAPAKTEETKAATPVEEPPF